MNGPEIVFLSFQILEQIFNFLPTKDLRSTRLVCSTWKLESDRTLKFRRQKTILFRNEAKMQRISDQMDKQKVFGCKTIFNNFAMHFNEGSDLLFFEQESVQQFFNRHGLSIEHLTLNTNLFSRHDLLHNPQSFKYLLEKQVPNLRSLEITGVPATWWTSTELFTDSQNLLPKLENILLYQLPMDEQCPLYSNLFSHLPTVKKIDFVFFNDWNAIFRQALCTHSNPLRTFFCEVEDIKIRFYSTDASYNFPNFFKLLPQACPKVRTLHLTYFPSMSDGVHSLLTKYQNQLEELSMFIDDFRDINPGTRMIDVFSTIVFKKLRVFRIHTSVFKASSLNTQLLHERLPMLESLTLSFTRDAVARPCSYELQHTGIHTLKLISRSLYETRQMNAELMLIGSVLPNIKSLHLKAVVSKQTDHVLLLVVRAFPNLEELNVDFDGIAHDAIVHIGALRRE